MELLNATLGGNGHSRISPVPWKGFAGSKKKTNTPHQMEIAASKLVFQAQGWIELNFMVVGNEVIVDRNP